MMRSIPVPEQSVMGRRSLTDEAVTYGEHISKLGNARPVLGISLPISPLENGVQIPIKSASTVGRL